MSEVKPFASLSSGLLARKGAAKPAMRPQGYAQMGVGLEDLGWNDMGTPGAFPAPAEHVPSSVAALTPAPKTADAAPEVVTQAPEPPVVEQQRALAASFADAAPAETPPSAEVVSLPPRVRQATGSRSKAAFTLRLDPERHLKLRLACAVNNRSAQQIVTEALDQFIESIPELNSLARQVPAKVGKHS